VTREGRLWLVAAALVLGVGLYKSINLVALLGCLLLAAWALNALLAGRGLRRLRGRRRVDRPVFAQEPVAVTLAVTNPGRGPLAGVRLEDHGARHRLGWFIPALAAGQTLRCRAEVTLPARGRYAWGEFTASSDYPFGLFRRRVALAPAAEMIVLPRLGRLHRGRFRRYLRLAGLARDRVRGEARLHLNAQAEFHGLRAFRSGDSPRWIHWRTSARCGELMVREFEDVPTDDLILVVDPRRASPLPAPKDVSPWRRLLEGFGLARRAPAPEPAPCPDLEAVVSLAATVCAEWCRQRGDRLLLIVAGARPVVLDGLTGPEHGQRLLECLALLEPEAPGSAAGSGLAQALAGRPLPDAPVLVLGVAPGPVGEALRGRRQRPVAVLTAGALAHRDFYEGPPAAAAAPGPGPREQSHAR
jgi:uncharacterized protein (DUF58 family)